MKTYEFSIQRTVRVRVTMTEGERLNLMSETDESRAQLSNYMDDAGRGYKGAPQHLGEKIYASAFREVKP